MMNTMSNNKLNIDELEMVNGGGFWDALVETVSSVLDTVKEPDKPFFGSYQWFIEAALNVKKVSTTVKCKKGENNLKFYGMSPGIVLERILLVREGVKLPESYLGPKESYIKKKKEEPLGEI